MEKIVNELVKHSKRLSNNNLVSGSGGNISIRYKNKIYISSSGSKLYDLSKKNISIIDIDKEHLDKNTPSPSSEWRMHLKCYKKRNDIKALVHTHPVYANVLGLMKSEKLSVSYEPVTVIGSEIKKIEFLTPGSQELAEKVSENIKNSNGLILIGHGILTVGKDISEAVDRNLCFEREAKRWVLEKIFAKLDLLDKKIVAELKNFIEL